jgi:single-strand DNA-binding protein
MKKMPNGDALCNFSVADGQGKDKPTIWWNCSLYGKRGESLSQYLVKGQAVTVSGTVSEREWTDKEGNKRKSMDVRVGDVALQGGRREAEPQQERRAAPRAQAYDDGGDVPF